MKMLRVLARGSAMVADHFALAAGARRFVGRDWDEELKDEANGIAGGWKPRKEPTTVPWCPEYVIGLRGGDLWPADKATAEASGLKFDPAFGGEYSTKKE